MSETTLGLDVSKWQDDNNTAQQIDFVKAHDQGARFVFIRAQTFTAADYKPARDEDFEYNWNHAQDANLLRGAYMFWIWRREIEIQIQLMQGVFYRSGGKYDGEMPPVLDLERYAAWGALPDKATLLTKLEKAMTAIDKWSGRQTILYTNPDIIKSYLYPVPNWLKARRIWIAHYGVLQPQIYNQWGKWDFWQFTDRLDGLSFGMESKQVDGDYWNGSLDELRVFCGLPPEKPVITDHMRLDSLEEWAIKQGYTPLT